MVQLSLSLILQNLPESLRIRTGPLNMIPQWESCNLFDTKHSQKIDFLKQERVAEVDLESW